MVSKHQRQLANIERRKRDREQRDGIQHSHQPLITQKQETVMNNHINKAKGFYARHKKTIHIVGGFLVAAALAAVAHKMLKNGRINDTIKTLGTIGFQPASLKAVKKEMKIEMKGAPKRNLQRAMFFKFPQPNRYIMTEEGIATNLKTGRVLKPVLDKSGDGWLIHFIDDNQFLIDPVNYMIESNAPIFAAKAAELAAEVKS